MTYRRILFSLPLLVFLAAPLTAQWEKVGWEGGRLLTMCQIGSDLYSMTPYYYDVYKSSDDGESWHLLTKGLPNTYFSSEATLSELDNYLDYTDRSWTNSPRFKNGDYLISPGAMEWKFYDRSKSEFKEILYHELVHSKDTIFKESYVIGSRQNCHLSISTDSGTTWKKIGHPLPDSVAKLNSQLIKIGKRIFFGIETLDTSRKYHYPLYYTDDLGDNWKLAITPVPDTLIFAIHQVKNSDLIFSYYVENYSGLSTIFDGFYRTSDNGTTWEKITDFPSNFNSPKEYLFTQIDTLLFFSASGYRGNVFASIFFVSTDSGKAWSKINGIDSVYLIDRIFKRSNSGDGYIISCKSDLLPCRLDNSLNILYPLSLRGVVSRQGSILYSRGNAIYANLGKFRDSITVSQDNGINWHNEKKLSDSLYFSSKWFRTSRGLCSFGSWRSGKTSLLKSTDDGSTWDHEEFVDTNLDLVDYGNFGDTLMVELYSQQDFLLSEDAGQHWRTIFPSLPIILHSCVIHNGKLFSGMNYVYSDTGLNKFAVSTDLGQSWQIQKMTLADSFRIDYFFSFGKNLFLFGATVHHGHFLDTLYNSKGDSVIPHIFVSTDDGITWAYSDEGIGPNSKPTYAIADNGLIYLVDNPIYWGSNHDGRAGVYFSNDTGKTWHKIQGTVPAVADLSIGSDYLYLTQKGAGLYRLPKSLASVRTGEPKYQASISITSIYPNPARDEMRVTYSIPKQTSVKLVVYDMTGKQIEILTDETESAGIYELKWDTRTAASGTYIIELSALGEKLSQVVEVVK